MPSMERRIAALDKRTSMGIVGNLDHTGGVVDFVDWVVEQVEDRVVAEIQRRGGRFREDF